MRSSIHKRSLNLGAHKTSVSLEDEFWSALKEIARSEGIALFELAAKIDRQRSNDPRANLSSALRLYVLDYYVRQNPPRASTTALPAAHGTTGTAFEPGR